MGIEDELTLRINGTRPVSAASVEAVQALCDRAEDHFGHGQVTLHVTGVPSGACASDLTVGLVSKWERALRRLERLPMLTVAMASGDCGGTALDLLLTADVRIATPDVRLLVQVDGEATWPGMSLYRLTQQAGAVGIRRAVLLGTPISAAEALELHLIHELSDDPESALEVTTLAGKELAIRRQLMFDAGTMSFEDALGQHLAACDRALRRAERS